MNYIKKGAPVVIYINVPLFLHEAQQVFLTTRLLRPGYLNTFLQLHASLAMNSSHVCCLSLPEDKNLADELSRQVVSKTERYLLHFNFKCIVLFQAIN